MADSVCLVETYHGLMRLEPRPGGLPRRVPPGGRVLSWHLVGDPPGWDAVQQELLELLPGLSGIRLLALEVRDPTNLTSMPQLARYCRRAGVQLRFDHVLDHLVDDEKDASSSIDRVR